MKSQILHFLQRYILLTGLCLIIDQFSLDQHIPCNILRLWWGAAGINGLEVTDSLLSAANTAAFMLMQIKRCSQPAAVMAEKATLDFHSVDRTEALHMHSTLHLFLLQSLVH